MFVRILLKVVPIDSNTKPRYYGVFDLNQTSRVAYDYYHNKVNLVTIDNLTRVFQVYPEDARRSVKNKVSVKTNISGKWYFHVRS